MPPKMLEITEHDISEAIETDLDFWVESKKREPVQDELDFEEEQ